MSEEYEVIEPDHDKDHSKRTRSIPRKYTRLNDEPFYVKNIPSYISCITTTSSNFLLSLIFSVHGVYYFNSHLTLAILFTIAITAITFVGTFKAVF